MYRSFSKKSISTHALQSILCKEDFVSFLRVLLESIRKYYAEIITPTRTYRDTYSHSYATSTQTHIVPELARCRQCCNLMLNIFWYFANLANTS